MFNVKNTKITAVIAAGLLCMTLASCTDDKSNVNNNAIDRQPLNSIIEAQPEKAHFTFLEREQDTPLTLQSTDKQTVYISASAEKASFVAENRADRNAAKKINDVLTRAADKSKNIYASLTDELDALFTLETPDMSTFPWEARIDFSCIRNDGKAISVLETIETASAGEIVANTFSSYNFDPVTGDQIGQIFYSVDDKASFDSADNVMYNKLVEKYGSETISYDNVSSSFVELAAQSWYFTEKGVQVIFNPGIIASADAGMLDIEYAKEELPELAQKYFN